MTKTASATFVARLSRSYLLPTHPGPPHPPHEPQSIDASWFISAASRFSLANLFAKRSYFVSLILCWTTHVGLVVSCVRENVIGHPVFLDQGHFARRKCLEFLLLRGSAGDDYFEASGDQKVLFVLCLRASAAHCQCEKRKDGDETESGD